MDEGGWIIVDSCSKFHVQEARLGDGARHCRAPTQRESQIHASSSGKIRINGLAIRQLALAAAAARHPFGRMYELKLASHVRRRCRGKIGNHPARVMRNEVR